MSGRMQSDPSADDKKIWEMIRRYVCPIYWMTDPSNPLSFIDNGTMFAVRFGFETYCITAKHVIDDYVAARDRGAILCLGSGFDGRMVYGSTIEQVMHDSDGLLDVTVFKLNSLPPGLEIINLDDVPPRPRRGDKAYMLGYPTTHINRTSSSFDFLQLLSAFNIENAWSDKATIRTLVSEVATYGTNDIVDYAKGLGGCSGGPVFQVSPGGIPIPVGIYTHIGQNSSSEAPSERIMEITPLSNLRKNGTLRK
jgi:hypothetical protein